MKYLGARRLANVPTVAVLLLALAGCGTEPAGARLTTEEYGELMAGCLTDAGWKAWPDEGGVAAEYDEDLDEEFTTDFAGCEHEIGADRPPELTDLEWRHLYTSYIVTIDCLRRAGVDMPDGAKWAEFRNNPLGSYYAYKQLPEDELHRLSSLEVLCPQPSFLE